MQLTLPRKMEFQTPPVLIKSRILVNHNKQDFFRICRKNACQTSSTHTLEGMNYTYLLMSDYVSNSPFTYYANNQGIL